MIKTELLNGSRHVPLTSDMEAAKLFGHALGVASILAVTDAKGVILHVNDNFCEVSQYSRTELLGYDHRKGGSGLHSKQFMGQLWSDITSVELWHGELCNKARDGSLYWLDVTMVPLLDAKGDPQQYLAICHDITHQKEVEHQLKLSGEFTEGVLDTLGSHIAVLNTHGTILNTNAAWRSFALANGETVLEHIAEGSNYLEVCERSETDGAKEARLALDGIRHVMEQDDDDFYLEYPCHSPDQKRWFGMRVKRFEGERSMVVVEHQNITERKLAEKSVLHHKELLVEAQKLAKLGNWNFDAATSEFYWSEGMKTMHGLPLNHTPNAETIANILHPEDRERVLDEMTRSRTDRVEVSSVYRIIRADTKQERTIRSTTDAEMSENGTLMRMFGIVEDITELHHAELERDELIDQLEQRVADRTAELTAQNKDILDSINYAKRIQTGILSPESEVESIFADSFVLSYPRDIVSGDFFWVHERHERKYIVVADCTGHGVPGALMSIIGNNLLNQIIIEERYNDPSVILEQLDLRLKRAIKGDHGEVQDGMDLVLCVIDQGYYQLHYAGALRPLFITDDERKIHEMKPDRQAIGGRVDEARKQFATRRSLIIPQQRIYLTSDGYYSQFGGPKDKKYMKSRFKNTLEAIQPHTMDEQKKLLRDALEEWAGDNEQVDDILVVGIEL